MLNLSGRLDDAACGRPRRAGPVAAFRTGGLRRCAYGPAWTMQTRPTRSGSPSARCGRVSRACKKLSNALTDRRQARPELDDRSGQIAGDCGNAAVRFSQEIPR
jgi:hypothetical protein